MRAIAAAAFLVALALPGAASAHDNSSSSSQSGSSSSGNAVGGPSVGVSRDGDVNLDMTNVSGPGNTDAHSVTVRPGTIVSTNVQGPSSATSGDASGSNMANTFVGESVSSGVLTDVA